jgi:hypothetical protein
MGMSARFALVSFSGFFARTKARYPVNASLILFGKITGLARHRRSNFARRHDVIGESSDRVWRDA